MERGPPEDVDRGVGGGLREADLAGARAGRERLGLDAGPGGDPGADVRQAGAALAGADARERRALEQLQLGVAGGPRVVEVPDRDAHAAADDGRRVGRRRRERMVGRRVADHLDRDGRAGHPRQHVPRRQAEVDDRRSGPRWSTRRRPRPRTTTARTRPAASPSKRTGARSTVTTGSGRATPAARSRSAARAVRIPARSLPGQTGWISAAPVATTISSASTWSTPDGVRATTVGPG